MREDTEKILKKLPYSKPKISKEVGMLFTEQIRVEMLGATGSCKQCSSCHGCR